MKNILRNIKQKIALIITALSIIILSLILMLNHYLYKKIKLLTTS